MLANEDASPVLLLQSRTLWPARQTWNHEHYSAPRCPIYLRRGDLHPAART